MNIYYHDYGHMTKMAVKPYMAKKPSKIILLWNQRTNIHETWHVLSGLKPIIVCSNDEPRLTLPYFTARSNLVI